VSFQGRTDAFRGKEQQFSVGKQARAYKGRLPFRRRKPSPATPKTHHPFRKASRSLHKTPLPRSVFMRQPTDPATPRAGSPNRHRIHPHRID